MIQDKFVIWGTGKISQNFYALISECDFCSSILWGEKITKRIAYFVDSNSDKIGGEFKGHSIKTVETLLDSDIVCVVAISEGNRVEVVRKLEERSDNRSIPYFIFDEFLEELKNCMVEKVINDDNAVEKLMKYKDDKIVSYLLNIVRLEDNNLSMRQFENIDNVQFISTVSTLCWRYGNKVSQIPKHFNLEKKNNNFGQKIKTIGLFSRRMFGGGAERVVAHLTDIFLKKGHNVILLTEEDDENDYRLSPDVIRYRISELSLLSIERRLYEIEKCVKENNIDILCYHYGEEHPEIYYEALFLNYLGVQTVMELHTSFLSRIQYSKQNFNNIIRLYKCMDKLVVLSEVDKLFWQLLGCDCTFIPNPTEGIVDKNSIGRYKKNESLNILWVGRVVQKAKNVLDVVPIMKKVVKQIPNAKLNIYGSADDKYIYKKLQQLIEEEGMCNHIFYQGYTKDINEVYNSADILLITSSVEGYPYVVLEGKARGIPIVMYDLPWIEALQDGLGYIAVAQGDKTGAAEEIIRLYENPSLRETKSYEAIESYNTLCARDIYSYWENLFRGKKLFEEQNTNNSMIVRMLLRELGIAVIE